MALNEQLRQYNLIEKVKGRPFGMAGKTHRAGPRPGNPAYKFAMTPLSPEPALPVPSTDFPSKMPKSEPESPGLPHLGWSFWWRWMLVSIIPFCTVSVLDYLNIMFYDRTWLLLGLLILTFYLQWRVINRYIQVPIRLIPVSAGGAILAVLFLLLYFMILIEVISTRAIEISTTNRTMMSTIVLFICGGILGAVQSLVLRKLFYKTYWWILANSAAIGAYGWFSSSALYPVGPIIWLFIYSGITGLVLAKMDRK
jgi:hypothetical protein